MRPNFQEEIPKYIFVTLNATIDMNIAEIESKLKDLKIKQAEQMKTKKDKRDTGALTAIREEMNKLKDEAAAVYKSKRK